MEAGVQSECECRSGTAGEDVDMGEGVAAGEGGGGVGEGRRGLGPALPRGRRCCLILDKLKREVTFLLHCDHELFYICFYFPSSGLGLVGLNGSIYGV